MKHKPTVTCMEITEDVRGNKQSRYHVQSYTATREDSTM